MTPNRVPAPLRVLIAGSRNWTNNLMIQRYIHSLPANVIIITGGADGADAIAHTIAELVGLETKVYPADWDKHGRGAGMIRNKQMVNVADVVCCFWDGKSPGTKNTIELALVAPNVRRVTVVKE